MSVPEHQLLLNCSPNICERLDFVQVTEDVFVALQQKYDFVCRGKIDIKGKGKMTTFFLTGIYTFHELIGPKCFCTVLAKLDNLNGVCELLINCCCRAPFPGRVRGGGVRGAGRRRGAVARRRVDAVAPAQPAERAARAARTPQRPQGAFEISTSAHHSTPAKSVKCDDSFIFCRTGHRVGINRRRTSRRLRSQD